MLAAIFYGIGCFVLALILTSLYAFTRPIQARGEMRSWRVLIGLFIFLTIAPYGGIEIMTRVWGSGMKPAVEEGLTDAGIKGDLGYYKVLFTSGKEARVLAVGVEEAPWGGTDKAVVKMTLKNEGENKWSATSFKIVYSENRNVDGLIIPPYW
ncbi:MAG: hypothetical protein KF784_10020 [Fimbriimonadaceae bacterium]|nr:hypothetical protein [Fimbriimonadaceae bacterium]